MDLWRLKIFRKVIEHKSFSKAADVIHLSQPTISSHIKSLEEHYGCRLIDRLEKKAVPTKAGELLYYHAGRLLAMHEETEAAMADFHGKISGKLVIGGSTIPAGYIFPEIIGKFIERYPEVKISLVAGDTKETINRILSSELELAIVGAKTNDKRIYQKKIIDDEMKLIVPAKHRWAEKNSINLKSLIQEPFIIRESGSGTLSSIQKSLSQKGLESSSFNVIAELGSTEAIIQGIKYGIGVSILSTIAVADDLKTGILKALTIRNLNLNREFYLTMHKDRSTSPLGKAFIDFIEKSILNP